VRILTRSPAGRRGSPARGPPGGFPAGVWAEMRCELAGLRPAAARWAVQPRVPSAGATGDRDDSACAV